jgi:hypothetical protein
VRGEGAEECKEDPCRHRPIHSESRRGGGEDRAVVNGAEAGMEWSFAMVDGMEGGGGVVVNGRGENVDEFQSLLQSLPSRGTRTHLMSSRRRVYGATSYNPCRLDVSLPP